MYCINTHTWNSVLTSTILNCIYFVIQTKIFTISSIAMT